MRHPDIQNYQSIAHFLQDLYELNKKQNSNASFRYFALKLKWPVSYLNDVIKSRKKLTIKRTLELGLFLRLDAVDMERMVFLSLQQSDDIKTHEFFSRKLNEEFDSKTFFKSAKTPEPIPENVKVIDETIYSDISLLAIFDLIAWANGEIQPQAIADLLFTFPELKNPDVLKSKLEKLTVLQLIEPVTSNGKAVRFKYLKKRLFFIVNRSTAHYMSQYAENYARMVKSSEAKAWVGSGFLMISQDKILEVKKRMIHFRNWMLSLDDRSINAGTSAEKLIFQFDLNLFSLISDPHRKIENLTAWGEATTK